MKNFWLLPTLTSVLALIGWWMFFDDDLTAAPDQAPAGSDLELPRQRLTALPPGGGTSLEQEIASLSLESVLAQLPSEPHEASPQEIRRDPRTRLLYRRLGVLLGGQALDEIGARWGRGGQAQSLSLYGMGQALAGWMSSDPETARDGLIAFVQGVRYEGGHAHITLEEKTVEFESDFAKFSVLEVLGEGIRAAAESDPQLGLALLKDERLPWNYRFLPSYARGLGADTDWAGLRQQLTAMVAQRDPAGSGSKHAIDFAVAHGWAHQDLDAALGWYLENRKPGRSEFDQAYALIRSLDDPGGEQVASWMNDRIGSAMVTDEFVKQYVERIAGSGDEHQFDRLTGLPSDESVRRHLVSLLAMPRPLADGGQILYHSPEALQRFIDAARLSPDAEAHWRSVVERNQHLPLRGAGG